MSLEDTMKKFFILVVLLGLTLSFAGCGGGGGSMNSPKGENPGKATLVELTPTHFVSQTNSDITLHAKVLDGNGNPVADLPVRFTNLSPVGSLDRITDKTNAAGIATATLHSHEVGFATIQAEVDEGLNQVRDRIVVYYSDFALMWPEPTIVLDIDADNDGIYNEASDFNFFETPTDDSATLRATAFDEFGKRIVGMNITFSGNSGSSFPLGNTFMTNSEGQAFTFLQVSPTSVVGQETSLLIQAVGSNGSADVIAVFLQPVYLTGINMIANPPGVVGSEGETATVTAYLLTSAGTIPDDLAVQFSVSPVTAGFVSPLVDLTDNGAASTVFTPSATYLGDAIVTATIGNVTNTITILVAGALTVSPPSQTVDGVVGGTATYIISNGIPPYTVTTDDATLPPVPTTVVSSGDTFGVTVPAGTAATTATYTVTDAAGHTVAVTLDVTFVPPAAPVADFIGIPVSGIAPLTVNFTDLSTGSPTSWAWSFGDGNTATVQNPSNTYAAAGTYTVTMVATGAGGSDSETKTGYITVIGPLSISPATVTISENALPQTLLFSVSGGTAGYVVASNNANLAFNDNGDGGGTANNGIRDGGEGGIWALAAPGPIVVTVPAGNIIAGPPDVNVTLTVIDAAAGTDLSTITIQEAI